MIANSVKFIAFTEHFSSLLKYRSLFPNMHQTRFLFMCRSRA